jgi:GTP-binding protein Era
MEINDNFNERDFEKEFSKAYDKEKNKFEEIKKSKLIISLLGDVNVGKSETMNALTGTKLVQKLVRQLWLQPTHIQKMYILQIPQG